MRLIKTANGTIYVGHVLESLAQMPPQSVHMVNFSGPYYGLRSYKTTPQIWGGLADCPHVWGEDWPPSHPGQVAQTKWPQNDAVADGGNQSRGNFCQQCGAWRGSFGNEPTPELYIEHHRLISRELWRVLRDDGLYCENLGDSYISARSRFGSKPQTLSNGVSHDEPMYGEKPDLRGNHPFYKDKDLALIPERVALSMMEDGWHLRNKLPWIKPNGLPESVENRFTTAHENWYIFAKSNDRIFWTHQDGRGSRQKPPQDYVYERYDGQTQRERPDNLNEMIVCPDCQGQKEVEISDNSGDKLLELTQVISCQRCLNRAGKATGEILIWKRINLWRGHDYFSDKHAVRLEQKEVSLARFKRATQSQRYIEAEYGQAQQSLHGSRPHDQSREVDTSRARRSSDWFYDSLGTMIEEYTNRLVHLLSVRQNYGLLMSLDGQPLALHFPVKGFKGAHFATFNEDLIAPLIKFATSEHGVCSHCGAPWIRQISRVVNVPLQDNPYINNGQLKANGTNGTNGTYNSSLGQSEKVNRQTIGWQPSCACTNNQPVPATVLDPFLGSGTTAACAQKLGRKWLGCELNEEYAAMAEARIRAGEPQPSLQRSLFEGIN